MRSEEEFKNKERKLGDEKLEDLRLSDEQAEETKAGPSGVLYVATEVGVFVSAENKRG